MCFISPHPLTACWWKAGVILSSALRNETAVGCTFHLVATGTLAKVCPKSLKRQFTKLIHQLIKQNMKVSETYRAGCCVWSLCQYNTQKLSTWLQERKCFVIFGIGVNWSFNYSPKLGLKHFTMNQVKWKCFEWQNTFCLHTVQWYCSCRFALA